MPPQVPPLDHHVASLALIGAKCPQFPDHVDDDLDRGPELVQGEPGAVDWAVLLGIQGLEDAGEAEGVAARGRGDRLGEGFGADAADQVWVHWVGVVQGEAGKGGGR